MARAAYANPQILLLDDPLSAVDAFVGQKIFENCVQKVLKGKTRILVTHQLQYLDKFDMIYVMEKGRIQQKGTYKQLSEEGYDFAKLLQEENAEKETKNPISFSHSSSLNLSGSGNNDELQLASSEDKIKGRIVEEEERTRGSVKFSVYKNYFLSIGSIFTISLFFFLTIARQICSVALQVWLSVWSDESIPNKGTKFYITVYISIAVVMSIFSFLRQILWMKGCIEASKNLHDRLLSAILKAPMSFFFKTPAGRIINRFSKDIESIGKNLIPSKFDFYFF